MGKSKNLLDWRNALAAVALTGAMASMSAAAPAHDLAAMARPAPPDKCTEDQACRQMIADAVRSVYADKGAAGRLMKMNAARDKAGIRALLIEHGAPKSLKITGFVRSKGLNRGDILGQPLGDNGTVARWVPIGTYTKWCWDSSNSRYYICDLGTIYIWVNDAL